MRRHPRASRTLLSVLIAAIGAPHGAWAAPLALAQYPAGSAYRVPAPNVIVTLDDSGSMGWYTGGGSTQDETQKTSRMFALKTALREVFGEASQIIPDGSIRMAWNTLNSCYQIPSSTGGCASLNRMRVLDATHRANFLNWVGQPGDPLDTSRRLSAAGSTPTHRAFIAAGDYLRNGSVSSAESPWANVPGTTAQPFLSCRRSYNVLMTDGGWNFSFASHGSSVSRPAATPNADGTTTTLPDGIVYDVNSVNTRLYRDAWGRSITSGNTTANVSTLADLAFYYWSTDLAPSLQNNLPTQIRVSGAQAFLSGSTQVELPEYWNPRNNPATWQHMTTYTIGFGDAAQWRTTNSYSHYPVWDAATNDTFGGSLPDLITGVKTWPDPIKGTLALNESSNSGDEKTTNGEARKTELWHMAVNSRGKFVPANSAQDLARAFREIMGEIVTDTSTPITSFSNASASLARTDTTQFRASYQAENWTGHVRADTLAQGTGAATPYPGWGTRTGDPTEHLTTADKLDALTSTGIANRLVLTWRDDLTDGGGTLFEWPSDRAYAATERKDISAAQKTLLKVEGSGLVSDTVGQQRLNFIRGDRTYEKNPFRVRSSRQGDIVNSQLWYVAAPASNLGLAGYVAFARTHKDRLPMVYVGGNDGMLHGFSAVDGSEKIAYVPKGVMHNLPALARTDYQANHRYFVDGSPFSGDVNWGDSRTPDWRTLLVGTLGAGGRGYFVLDVTNPGSTATDSTAQQSNFAKQNAAALVVMDRTAAGTDTPAAGSEAADIGHIMVDPVLEDGNLRKTTQIVRMNNGRWALVTGNGYNSASERPVLLIQYLDGARELLRIPAATTGADASSNGLSAPRLVDLNGDGTPDVVYAGDLRGNVWKFDVASSSAANWAVAFTGRPLYTAQHTANNVTTRQPITAPPLVRANDRGAGGLMVAFGTGRNLTEADRTSTTVQSIYAVLDNTRYRIVSGRVVIDTDAPTPEPVGAGVDDLVRQSVDDTVIRGSGDSAARNFYTISQNEVPFQGAGRKKGWFLDLPVSGERVLVPMSFYDESNIIELMSVVPASGGSVVGESCAPPPTVRYDYRTLLNIMDGRRPSVQVMDANGDGVYDAKDQSVSRMSASSAEGRVRTRDHQLRIGDGTQGSQVIDRLRNIPEIPLRPNWRQLQ